MQRKATPNSWKRSPFGTGIELSYRTTLNPEQFLRLQLGVIPQVMEDKWFVYYEEPCLYFHRSWTGLPVYRLTLEAREGSVEVVQALLDSERAQQQGTDIDWENRVLDFLLYALVLGERREFPMPRASMPGPKGILQHHISGTAFPESEPKPGTS